MSTPLPDTARRNVEAIAELEQGLLGRRSRVERVAGVVTRFFGSLWFVSAHAGFIAAWFAANAGRVPGAPAFDPFPFPFLSLLIGVEFIFLTTFVLMNQQHAARRQEHWAHLNLQVCLLNEQEATKTMQMIQRLCGRAGIEDVAEDQEVKELARETEVATLVEEIKRARTEGDTAGMCEETAPRSAAGRSLLQ